MASRFDRVGWSGMIMAFGLDWLDGLLDDTSVVIWALMDITNVIRIMKAAACVVLLYAIETGKW